MNHILFIACLTIIWTILPVLRAHADHHHAHVVSKQEPSPLGMQKQPHSQAHQQSGGDGKQPKKRSKARPGSKKHAKKPHKNPKRYKQRAQKRRP